MRVASPKDAAAGLLLVGIAAGMLLLSRSLPLGTAMRMGPGYYPVLVSWILLGFGVLIFARSFVLTGPPLERWSVRALIPVLAAVGVFSLGMDPPDWVPQHWKPLGLFLSIVLMVIVGSFGSREARPIEVSISAVALGGFSVLIFIDLLGLPMPAWPAFVDLLR
jgi:hypothetical protein